MSIFKFNYSQFDGKTHIETDVWDFKTSSYKGFSLITKGSSKNLPYINHTELTKQNFTNFELTPTQFRMLDLWFNDTANCIRITLVQTHNALVYCLLPSLKPTLNQYYLVNNFTTIGPFNQISNFHNIKLSVLPQYLNLDSEMQINLLDLITSTDINNITLAATMLGIKL